MCMCVYMQTYMDTREKIEEQGHQEKQTWKTKPRVLWALGTQKKPALLSTLGSRLSSEKEYLILI